MPSVMEVNTMYDVLSQWVVHNEYSFLCTLGTNMCDYIHIILLPNGLPLVIIALVAGGTLNCVIGLNK